MDMKLADIFGEHVIPGDSQQAGLFAQDHNRYYLPKPYAVVFPQHTGQVQQLVQVARQSSYALVPSGGRTGLSGGACASAREIVVAFDRMNNIVSFDANDRIVRCEAGVITQQLQEYAEEKQLMYPVSFASRGSSQIGGNIATNAGGIKVIRYGLTRDWVAGLTVVTGRGDVLELNKGLVKNATGYDLRHLLIGSEGTLGLITHADIHLTTLPDSLQVLFFAVESIGVLMRLAQRLRSQLAVTAFEFMCDRGLRLNLRRMNVDSPLQSRAPFYVLLEFETKHDSDLDAAMDLFESCMEEGLMLDAALAQNQSQFLSLWALRENLSETLSAHMPYKNDLSVRISRVAAFIEETERLVGEYYPEFQVVWFGHIGDGNLHLNILKPESWDPTDFKTVCEKVNQQIFKLVASFEGSISAEHGVGLQKRDFLHFSRSEEEIALMRGIKAVFDPDGILNPGKLLPGESI